MALFGSPNPMLKEEKFRNVLDAPFAIEGKMTVQGAVDKTLMMMGMLLFTGAIGYLMPNILFIAVGGIICFGVTIWANFQPQKSTFIAPIYALFKGLLLGSVTAGYAAAYDGIVIQAVLCTIGILGSMLLIYKSKIIQVTDKFRMGMGMAVGGIAFSYLIIFVLSLFGVNMPFLHSSSPMAIGMSVVILIIATLNLLINFDNIEKGARYGSPKYMEWYSAMGLVITIVWIYFELLRLMSKLASRD
jgi:uncharacterized YccA/Bax inhibitor family protein